MQQSLAYIHKELANFYPKEEIDGFIQIILHHLHGYSYTDIILKRDEALPAQSQQEIAQIVLQLQEYQPIQYILGTTDFCDLTFKVNPSVLIPRPETEELIRWIKEEYPAQAPLNIFDICTGSGCIAISLKSHFSQATLSACDISDSALQVAQENAQLNKCAVSFEKLDILHADNYSPSQPYDIIVSNPPYVMEKEKALMNENVLAHEPHLALFVDDDSPLVFYQAIARFGRQHLKPQGSLYFEINEQLPQQTAQILEAEGYHNISCRNDINGKARMIRAQKK